MPLTSAKRLASRLATVFDFLPALARRHMSARVGARGTVQVVSGAPGVFTLVHQHRVSCGAELVEHRIAQLRAVGQGADSPISVNDKLKNDQPNESGYQLYWKKGNGRWTAYCTEGDVPFAGSLNECLTEIARDPYGCYWP